MANKKTPTNTLTRDLSDLAAPTGNIYETVVILSKRANQIAIAEKKELTRKLEDFKSDRDTMEEVFENREQIEISKYYEKQPKPRARFVTTSISLAATWARRAASATCLSPRA